MSSDDDHDNYNEDQIINLISALQQKIKTNRTNNELSQSNILQNNQRKTFPNNEFSLRGEQSKHSSISESLSDIMVKTDKRLQEVDQEQQIQPSNEYQAIQDEMIELKQKVDYLISQRERDREIIEQANSGIMFLISQLPKPKQTNSIGIQTQGLKENIPQNQLTPQNSISNKKKTAQQTVQQMFQEPDKYAFKEIRNFCLKRS